MSNLTEIRWHGRGGQGAKTAALLLADVAFQTGKYVQGFPEYGPERMGAPITAYNRISDRQIRVHSNIYDPQYVVVVDESLLETVDVTKGLKKDGAILINTARGPIVNRDALIKALKNKEIKGACLDVFEKEPPINDTELCSLDNVILLPHVGYFTKEAMKKRFDIVEQNLMSYLIESKFLNRIV